MTPEICSWCFKLTFDLFGGFYILCVPLEGAYQGADVCKVHLTAHKVLQTFQTVLKRPTWTGLQVVDLSLKRLQHNNESSVKQVLHWNLWLQCISY